MLPNLINILGGFLLAAPLLKGLGAKEAIEKMEAKLRPHSNNIGWLVFIVGIIILVERILESSTLQLLNGDSYPQAIPLILMGLIFLKGYFSNNPAISKLISVIDPYREWIGLFAILAGLFSILGICIMCGSY